MFGIRLRNDLWLSAKILRPSFGRWSILDTGRSWDDFDNCRATAVRSVRVGLRLRRCWVTAQKLEVDGLAAFVASGLTGAKHKGTFLHFNFYAVDPHIKPHTRATVTLGGGLTIPRRLPKAFNEAMLKLL